jgi:isoleucyl-tRNA synthetase
VQTLKGAALENLQPRHPFIDRASPVVLADYVTTDSGTGAVHTAPGHGAEDYQTGLKYKLPIYCPVGDDGRYLDDGQVPADLVGITTLETVEELKAKKPSPANLAVLKKLAEAGALLAKAKYVHSYPHCWRSKTPIIFRAVDQWFVSLDQGGVRQTALSEITQIAQNQGWIPAWGEARIRGAVESRPDWCISRQRTWGTPIPAFYDAKKQPFLDATVARAVADKIASRGSNFWYEATAAEILAGVPLPSGWPAPADLVCGRDTLDVWIDSGSTQAAVLKRGQGGTSWPADLYLEGSDQHRGWFQSSLWCSVIASGGAPYKAVLTHGFIVDKDRQKISKSSTYQKPQTADAYIAQHGADVIRLWIASQDFRDDIPVDDEILKNVGEAYRLFRNTFRFQLSTLFDFDAAQHAVPVEKLDVLDRWALHQTATLIEECTKAFDAYEFHRVYQLCNQFCSVTLSATYHDILKDRLYTLGTAHPLRRSSQTAIHHIFGSLVRLLAPFLTFTADEAWSYATDGQGILRRLDPLRRLARRARHVAQRHGRSRSQRPPEGARPRQRAAGTRPAGRHHRQGARRRHHAACSHRRRPRHRADATPAVFARTFHRFTRRNHHRRHRDARNPRAAWQRTRSRSLSPLLALGAGIGTGAARGRLSALHYRAQVITCFPTHPQFSPWLKTKRPNPRPNPRKRSLPKPPNLRASPPRLPRRSPLRSNRRRRPPEHQSPWKSPRKSPPSVTAS